MNKIVQAASALAVFAAIAAPVQAQEAVPYDWSGFYGGVHAGFGKSATQWDIQFIDGSEGVGGSYTGTYTIDDISKGYFPLLGFQLGHNEQDGMYVRGIEGDLSLFNSAAVTAANRIEVGGVGVIGTLRGRVGVLVEEDLLLYGTGGLAFYLSHGASGTEVDTAGGDGLALPYQFGIGGVIGGGAEYFVDEGVSVFGTVLYHYLVGGSTSASSGASSITGSGNASIIVAKAGINFHLE